MLIYIKSNIIFPEKHCIYEITSFFYQPWCLHKYHIQYIGLFFYKNFFKKTSQNTPILIKNIINNIFTKKLRLLILFW